MLDIILASAAVLVLVVLILMFRVQALLAVQRGSHDNRGGLTNKVNAALFVVFFVVMTALAIWYTFTKVDEYTLPISASTHGHLTDGLFIFTMGILGVVVLITHILLFGFSFKYQFNAERKAKYYPDNHKLELIWTLVPAVVLTVLVFRGWKVWSATMGDVDPKKLEVARSASNENKEIIEVEAIAKQFGWEFRYPGADGIFGRHDFRKLSLTNTVGYDFSDPENAAALDDFSSTTLILPKDKEVIVKIRALDVIHSFYLPHFRVKMDAVPGMPTKFRFVPEMTTLEMRAYLATIPAYTDTTLNGRGVNRAENFNYEVVCAEICGKGHYTMRGAMEVVRVDEYWDWFEAQSPWSLANEDYVIEEIKSSGNMKAIAEFTEALKKLKGEGENSSEQDPESGMESDTTAVDGDGNGDVDMMDEESDPADEVIEDEGTSESEEDMEDSDVNMENGESEEEGDSGDIE